MQGREVGQSIYIHPRAEKSSVISHDHDSHVLVLFHLIQTCSIFLAGEIEHILRRMMQRNPRHMVRDRQQLVQHNILLAFRSRLLSA